VIRQHAPKAKDVANRRYRHRGVVYEIEQAENRTKSSVRAKVEHANGAIKRVFGFAKVRYRIWLLVVRHQRPGQLVRGPPPLAQVSRAVVCPQISNWHRRARKWRSIRSRFEVRRPT